MIIVISGGSGSGKSAYAEKKILSLRESEPLYYLATMQIYDGEGKKKVERHRTLREGKGFITIEQPLNVGEAAYAVEGRASVLLECMSNLTANEMFINAGTGLPEGLQAEARVMDGVRRLAKRTKHLVIVTNNVFEDGKRYDEGTMRYIETLGRINCRLAEIADEVTEVVAGIPVEVK
ncbi:adenosylcobinamide kinase /adenosylcobinamide-phosphate guanylyltransferase [Kineothrix alysoides]|uniref:Adenosylcobinamide kinase n=1 Tax=Kineothrix alysoides TaxID=1469948 RepID=A0A4R1QUA8_9FIRM|nr:bifunctional adenosylcobinamide kinase/adenosylcobinamide-phosphate guanylyltransferase [Kineothrix alysoides]TCL57498.1 adenosylcobinamide kinase /adenosylcobinamide-phosphate guanylyltransferase [Kineothrix alysoides]